MKQLLLLFLPLISFGQRNISGNIVDKTTGKGIPYATVGLIKQNKGISTNEQGAFAITSFFPKVDSLRISSIGYETLVVQVSDWVNGKVVEISPEVNMLDRVVISLNHSKKVYTLNKFGRCSWNWHQVGLETFSQLAQRFDAPGKNMQLIGLDLCKDPLESIFRIRIYDMDSITQGPFHDLVDTIIEVRSKGSKVHINLENHHIIIPGKSFFVAIEWIFISSNEELQKMKKKGKTTYSTYYKPFIKFVYNKEQEAINLWRLEFNGKWTEAIFLKDYNFQITTTLR